MSGHEGTEPVGDDELLFRRVPVSKRWFDANGLSPEAFDPREDEATGISVFREKYTTIEKAAAGKSKRGYFIAVFRASDLRKCGIEVVPRPGLDDPGHAELPDLTCSNRLASEALERKLRLSKLYLQSKARLSRHRHEAGA